MIDAAAQKFGLPGCLWVPIAADTFESIRTFVGQVLQTIPEDSDEPNAVCVRANDYPVARSKNVPLWSEPRAADYAERLHPARQVWERVDYSGYRNAYQQFGMPTIPPGNFLDHVQNREAIRLRNYSHPYLRLCPVDSKVNTSGGVNTGGEGMEKEYLRWLKKQKPAVRNAAAAARQQHIVYADPMDLTKMLNIAPGTQVLAGVGQVQKLFFPKLGR